jgi:hypothetical protein
MAHDIVLTLALGALALAPVRADFNVAATAMLSSGVQNLLAAPVVHSKLLQDGFRSTFFLNGTGVDYNALGSMMFAQIRTLSQSFYHLWAGFENGAFLGYYQAGVNAPAYSLSWQEDLGMACPYSYTSAQWEGALNIPASGIAAETDPASATLTAFCRESFTASQLTGRKDDSLSGAPYDCRKRGWYFTTKRNLQKQWSGMYVVVAVPSHFSLICPLIPMLSQVISKSGPLLHTCLMIGHCPCAFASIWRGCFGRSHLPCRTLTARCASIFIRIAA